MPEQDAPTPLVGSGSTAADAVPADQAQRPAGDTPSPPPVGSPWRRMRAAFLRPSLGQLAMGVVVFLVTLAVVVQVRSQGATDDYSTLRRTDLVQLLDQLDAEQARLGDEADRLQRTREQLASGADAQRVAQAENQKRLETLGILNGTLPARGPGIRLTIVDPQQRVTPEILLDAVEEMRDAGAEAIEVNDQVRIVASSWFGGQPGQLQVDGNPVTTPLVVDVIGEPHALEEGARFRGGLVSQVQAADVGGRVMISRLDQVQVTSLHEAETPQWAKPA